MTIDVLEHVDLADGATLSRYWQQQPVVLKQAVDTQALVPDPEILRDILTQTDLPARLITGEEGGQFTLKHGPFDRFDPPKGPWTVLIQALEHLFPEYDALRRQMLWLPSWRFEDCMLSWASHGGSVGRHFDQFSVFLVQLNGRRRWELGPEAQASSPLLANQPLALVGPATPDLTIVVKPGDVVYLPPRVVHHGVALDPDCMTLSIGFRAPDIGQILEIALEHCDATSAWLRFNDPDLGVRRGPAEITHGDLAHLDRLIAQFTEDRAKLASILATRVTSPYLDNPPEAVLGQAEAMALIEDDGQFELDPGTRMAYFERTIFINGEHIGDQAPDAILQLADSRVITSRTIRALEPSWRNHIVTLLTDGDLQPAEDAD